MEEIAMNILERVLFELGLIWAEIVRWAMTQDPLAILGLGIVIVLILYLILMLVAGLGNRK